MSKNQMQEFCDKIISTLTQHGYPQKRVSLPLEKMYEASEGRSLSFNSVLENLETMGVNHEKEGEKIIFRPANEEDKGNFLNGLDTDLLKNMDQDEVQRKAADFMKNMTEEDRKRIFDMYANMSEEEKAELMRKGKEMGIVS